MSYSVKIFVFILFIYLFIYLGVCLFIYYCNSGLSKNRPRLNAGVLGDRQKQKAQIC